MIDIELINEITGIACHLLCSTETGHSLFGASEASLKITLEETKVHLKLSLQPQHKQVFAYHLWYVVYYT